TVRELGCAPGGGCVGTSPGVLPRTSTCLQRAPPGGPGRIQEVIPTGIQHGTVTVVIGGNHVEVTTFRSEGDYLDGRRPSSVTFERDITQDLSRRDFTINAMAYDPVGQVLVDPFGGMEDLQAHLIRCVRSPLERFSEDGLRPMRAVRFAAVLGFTLEPATREAIPPTLPIFKKVALERVREEFVKLLLSPRAELGLTLLGETGLLEVFLPELAQAGEEAVRLARAAAQAAPAEVEIRLAALLADLVRGAQARDIALRLKFPTKAADTMAVLVEHAFLERRTGDADPALRRLLAQVGPALLEPLLAVARARVEARQRDRLPEVLALQERLRALLAAKPPLTPKELALSGKDIMATLGIGPSPQVGEATRFLMEAVFDAPDLNESERLKDLLRTWQAGKGV
ncbi:CCA tRNA nucleotidyltransferase, partial [Stigmatella aurantiaca]|uniref:CCA tRNA nucleotidyltransferase n=1 Tax=Stigmatella aurantiaca TaxID=41 RepID=UPI000AFE7F20